MNVGRVSTYKRNIAWLLLLVGRLLSMCRTGNEECFATFVGYRVDTVTEYKPTVVVSILSPCYSMFCGFINSAYIRTRITI